MKKISTYIKESTYDFDDIDNLVITEYNIDAFKKSGTLKYGYHLFETKGDPIDEQWLNDEKPVMTKDGKQVIITKIDYSEVPNVIHGSVKIKDKLFEFEWTDDGACQKAVDQYGNPKQPDDNDILVKAI